MTRREKNMITFTLLMITISGITAIQSGKPLHPKINVVNHSEIHLGNLTGIEHARNQSILFTGTLDSFFYTTTYSTRGLFATIFPIEPEYYDNKYNITADLNYRSWGKLFSDYTHAAFVGHIRIEFSRNDGRGRKILKQVVPKRIKLGEIHMSNTDVEELSYQKNIMISQSDMADPVMSTRDIPFFDYKETVFDESICYSLSRIYVKVHLSLEGYIEDNAMILKVVYRVTPSFLFANSGMSIVVKGLGNVVLRNW